ncbi:MAG: hypothetical protein IJ438_07525 [Clostridia bacterium]|nr:hypothetical protein [Clostridia bacterium]
MKKLTALLMALLMLALPVMSMAETDFVADAVAAGRRSETTVKLHDLMSIGEATIDAALADLLAALNITAYEQGDEIGFAVKLDDTDVLTYAALTEGDTAYIQSNLLGGTISYTKEELPVLLERLVDILQALGLLDKAAAAEMKAIFAETDYTAAAAPEIDLESLNLTAFDWLVTELMSSMTIAEVTQQPKNCDPATSVVTVTITPEQMLKVFQSTKTFLQDNPELLTYLEAQFAGMTDENGDTITFAALMDELVAEMEANNPYGTTNVAVYMNDADEMVAMTVEGAAVITEGSETTEAPYTMNYSRLTQNDGYAHTATMVMDAVSMTVNVLEQENHWFVGFSAVDAQTIINVNVDVTTSEAEAAATLDAKVDVEVTENEETVAFGLVIDSESAKDGADAACKTEVTVNFMGMNVIGMTINTVTGEPAASIKDGTVVAPAAMEDTEFQNWFAGIINGLQTWIFSVIQALPASVLELVQSMG